MPFLLLIIFLSVTTTIGAQVTSPAVIAARVSSNVARDLPIADLFNNWKLVKLASNVKTNCNDGSPAGFYIRKGTGKGTNSWVIWLEGGGGCGDAKTCLERKKLQTALTTSKLMTPLPQNIFQGIIANEKNSNPDFFSYNHVLMHYCSSDFWGGEGVTQTIEDKSKFTFNGRNIIHGIFDRLEANYNFKNATNIIFSGTSAGGAGVTINLNSVKDRYPTKDVVGIIEGQWTIQKPAYILSSHTAPDFAFRPVIEYSKTKFDPACELKETDKYKCMLPQFAHKYFRAPVFIVSDQLDSALLAIYNMYLCTNADPKVYSPWLDDYTTSLLNSYSSLLTQPPGQTTVSRGLFSSRTGYHAQIPITEWTKKKITQGTISYSIADVFGNWYFNRAGAKVVIGAKSSTLKPHQEMQSRICREPLTAIP